MLDVAFVVNHGSNDARAIASEVTAAGLAESGVLAGLVHTAVESKVIVVSAPVSEAWLSELVQRYPKSKIVIWNHTCFGVLSREILASTLEYVSLTLEYSNLYVGVVKPNVETALRSALGTNKIVWLPSVYRCQFHEQHTWIKPGEIHVGLLGAFSVVKNQFASFLAAKLLADRFQRELIVHMPAGHSEGRQGALEIEDNLVELASASRVQLIRVPCAPWESFKCEIENVDIMFNCSYTEALQLLTADGISVGTSSVVSGAIPYAPQGWIANPDSPVDMASVARRNIMEPWQMRLAYGSLISYSKNSADRWKQFLTL